MLRLKQPTGGLKGHVSSLTYKLVANWPWLTFTQEDPKWTLAYGFAPSMIAL